VWRVQSSVPRTRCVIPAKAGIHLASRATKCMDSRLRGNDVEAGHEALTWSERLHTYRKTNLIRESLRGVAVVSDRGRFKTVVASHSHSSDMHSFQIFVQPFFEKPEHRSRSGVWRLFRAGGDSRLWLPRTLVHQTCIYFKFPLIHSLKTRTQESQRGVAVVPDRGRRLSE